MSEILYSEVAVDEVVQSVLAVGGFVQHEELADLDVESFLVHHFGDAVDVVISIDLFQEEGELAQDVGLFYDLALDAVQIVVRTEVYAQQEQEGEELGHLEDLSH